ncbi:porin family protein [Vibrio coralliilyticus]|uniref:porin family protein n=1 Tax=Vibrio coralliilyticus TaxID=190893 RepID=UPI002FD42264
MRVRVSEMLFWLFAGIVSLLVAGVAHASIFVGAGVGKLSESNSTGVDILNKDTSYEFSVGYSFNRYLSLSGEFHDLGSIKSPDQFGDYKVKSVGISIVPRLPLGDIAIFKDSSIYGKLGYHRWDIDTLQNNHIYDNDLYWGVGVTTSVLSNLYANIGFTYYNLDISQGSVPVNMNTTEISLGLVYRF